MEKNNDYEKAKQECWDALYKEHLKDEVQWQPVSRKEIFSLTFDRAYNLGIEAAKKEQSSDKTKAIIKTVVTVVGTLIACAIGVLIAKLIEHFIGDWLNMVISAILIIAGGVRLYRFNLKEMQNEKR